MKLTILSILAVVLGAAISLTSPSCFQTRTHSLAKALSNARQVKFALDGFAVDFDGHFPSAATGLRVVDGGTGTSFSNDYLRQLVLAGETESEEIFWMRPSPVTNKRVPDDRIRGDDGELDPKLILEAGDCHWAYVTGQTNTSPVNRPLLMDPFEIGKPSWDEDLWDRKVVIVRVDGSVRAMRMRAADGNVLDDSNHAILSWQSDAWRDLREARPTDPRSLVVQPEQSRSR